MIKDIATMELATASLDTKVPLAVFVPAPTTVTTMDTVLMGLAAALLDTVVLTAPPELAPMNALDEEHAPTSNASVMRVTPDSIALSEHALTTVQETVIVTMAHASATQAGTGLVAPPGLAPMTALTLAIATTELAIAMLDTLVLIVPFEHAHVNAQTMVNA